MSKSTSSPRALVTGGGVRVGRAIALALAHAGFDIALHYHRSAKPAADTASEIRAAGRAADVYQADLTDPDGCMALAAQVGHIDVLVNNAADYRAVSFDRLTVHQWDRMQAINCRAPFLLTQAFVGPLRASQLAGGGLVVNIGDIGGTRPVPGFSHYSVSKAGLLMLTRALALELAPDVRVNAVSPGTVMAPKSLSAAASSAIVATIPAGRFGQASDIGRAVVFLAQSPYMTGQDIAVDGGRSVGGPMVAG